MKMIATAFCVCISLCCVAQEVLQEVRNLYSAAGRVQDSATKMFKLLRPVDSHSSPILQCYKGAVIMVGAKYSINPFRKFSAFSNGKKQVEKAIQRDSNNVEMHYIRFTLQTNLPSFLGYHDNINNDKEYIISQYRFIQDATLRSIIAAYFRVCSYCTGNDIKRLNNG